MFTKYCRQSLALMFDDLSDLVEPNNNSITQTSDSDEEDSESKQEVLGGDNYSWCARNGKKVIVDSELKKGCPIPSPSMYGRKAYTIHKADNVLASTPGSSTANMTNGDHEVDSIGDCSRSNSRSDSLKEEEADASSTNDSKLKTKQFKPDGQFAMCNGCISHDLKAENSQSCDSSDVVVSASTVSKAAELPCKTEYTDVTVKSSLGSSIDRKVAKSAQDLEALEAKLSLSRKRRLDMMIGYVVSNMYWKGFYEMYEMKYANMC